MKRISISKEEALLYLCIFHKDICGIRCCRSPRYLSLYAGPQNNSQMGMSVEFGERACPLTLFTAAASRYVGKYLPYGFDRASLAPFHQAAHDHIVRSFLHVALTFDEFMLEQV